jgi:hypothetical protein
MLNKNQATSLQPQIQLDLGWLFYKAWKTSYIVPGKKSMSEGVAN